jgi:hypothetical protein
MKLFNSNNKTNFESYTSQIVEDMKAKPINNNFRKKIWVSLACTKHTYIQSPNLENPLKLKTLLERL